MSDSGFRWALGKIPTHNSEGKDVTQHDLGAGGTRRTDGKLSSLAYDLEYVDGEADAESEFDEEDEDEEEGGSLAALAGLAVAGVAIAAVGSWFGRSRAEKEQQLRDAKHASASELAEQTSIEETDTSIPPPAGWYEQGEGQRWWDGRSWTEHVRQHPDTLSAPPGWYTDGHGAQRWWNGQRWTEHLASPAGAPNHTQHHPAANVQNALLHGPGSDSAQTGYRMSPEEWSERMRMMLLSRIYSEAQWQLLSDAQIEGADSSILAWQADLRHMTPQRFAELAHQYLATDPSFLHHMDPHWLAPHSWQNHQVQLPPQSLGWAPSWQETQSHAAAVHTPPGWYDDGAGRQRWWDGWRWL